MRLVSDHILKETRQNDPVFAEIYPRLTVFDLGSPAAFTPGHPFEHYKALRESAPVSWTPLPRKARGFWSVTRYSDIKQAELAPDIFSSERGSINMAIPPKYLQHPRKLLPAALNNLINLDAPRHMELRLQQKNFFIPKYVASLKDKVGRKIDHLLDAMEAATKNPNGPHVDFIKMFSEQLPLYTLCEMLGGTKATGLKSCAGCTILKWRSRPRRVLRIPHSKDPGPKDRRKRGYKKDIPPPDPSARKNLSFKIKGRPGRKPENGGR